MKILYLVHQFFPEHQSGTEKFVLNLALQALNYGHDVKVITYSFLGDETFSNDDGEIYSKEYSYKNIPVIAYKYKNSSDHVLNVLESKKLRNFAIKTIIDENPDILHFGHIIRVHEFIWAAINLDIPYIITLTDFFLICPKINLITSKGSLCNGPNSGTKCNASCSELNNNYIRYRLEKAKEILENARHVFSPSKFVQKIFQHELKQIQIEINPHGISLVNLSKPNKFTEEKNKLVLAYLSRITEIKGIRVLIEAFSRIESDDIVLKIYGAGEEKYLNNLQESVKGDERIIFLGEYDSSQLISIYQQIDLSIIPSLCYETFSMVLHESLACNVPVLVSGIGALAEKIRSGENGLTFLPGDVLDLQNKIEFLTRRPDVLVEMKSFIKNHVFIPKIQEEFENYLRFYIKSVKN